MSDQQTRDFAFQVLHDYLRDLQDMMADPETNEIMINRHNIVYRERRGVMQRIEGLSLNPEALDTAITMLANINDKDQTPLLDARLPGLRIAAARFPVAIHGDMLAIRKHSVRRIRLDDYVGNGAFDVLPASKNRFIGRQDRAVLETAAEGGAALMRCLQWIMRQRYNIVFSGGTSSGKTTLLNALLEAIPESDRIVTIEDTAELQIILPNFVSFEANQGVTIRNLIKFALRIRPDRIFVGEVRGAEAFDLVEALNTGHDGSICTLHANSADEAPYKLESYIRMSEEGRLIATEDLRKKIASTFRFFLHADRQGDGTRGPVELREVLGVEDGRYKTRLLFSRFA
ncbi:Type IV secretion system protein VirB11 [Ralstonia syzygii subsp. syzygii]|nr:Type IV secretion system protein VirB11 [Ralstonia syzygii subsp. syzygii]